MFHKIVSLAEVTVYRAEFIAPLPGAANDALFRRMFEWTLRNNTEAESVDFHDLESYREAAPSILGMEPSVAKTLRIVDSTTFEEECKRSKKYL